MPLKLLVEQLQSYFGEPILLIFDVSSAFILSMS